MNRSEGNLAVDKGNAPATVFCSMGTIAFTCSPFDTPATASGGVIFWIDGATYDACLDTRDYRPKTKT
jgi:hypothetical protein